jgi:hypothetical protein
MSEPLFTLTFNDHNVTLRLDKLPRQIQDKMVARIAALTRTLLAQVHAAEPRRSGRLHSLTRAFIDQKPGWVRGRVRILSDAGRAGNVAAAALEYGVHRTVLVRRHGARLTHLFGHSMPVQIVQIRAHTRRVDIAQRRFLRGPAAIIRQQAHAELSAALSEALAQNQRS